MTDEDWHARACAPSACGWRATRSTTAGARGERIVDDTLLLLLNAADEAVEFRLPEGAPVGWRLMFDTRAPDPPTPGDGPVRHAGSVYRMTRRSVALFRLPRAE